MADQETYRLSSARKRKIWFARKLRFWPLALWILLAAFVAVGIRSTSRVDQVYGVVDYPTLSVAATETGRIETIFVAVGQSVAQNDPLLKLSSLEIDYEIASLQANLEEEKQATQRQFFNSLQNINAELRELTMQQAQDEAELEVLEKENKRLEALLAQRLIDTETVVENRTRIVVLESAIRKYPDYLQALRTEKAQLEKLENESPQSPKNNREVQLSILNEREKGLTICANHPGIISNVIRKPGDVVSAGEPLLELLGNGTPVIQGFIPLSAHRSIQPGDAVYLADRNDKLTIYEGMITSISPSIIGIADTSTPIVPRTVMGRMFTVESQATEQWVEREQVSIYLEKPSDSVFQHWIHTISSWFDTSRIH